MWIYHTDKTVAKKDLTKTPGGKRCERDELENRLDIVAEKLAMGWSGVQIWREYGVLWDVKRESVFGYMKRVRDRNRTAAEAHTPRAQEKRDHLKEICFLGIKTALEKKRAVVLTTKDGFDSEDRIEMVPDPDLGAVSRFVSELAKLDGLYNQTEADVKISYERTTLILREAYGGLSREAEDSLRGVMSRMLSSGEQGSE